MSVLSDTRQVFNSNSSQWSPHIEYNQLFLKAQQQYMNDLIRSTNSPIFLNEIFDVLGLPRTRLGQIVGWIPGSIIDFGAEVSKENPNEVSLNFNIDGEVWNHLP